MAAETGNGWGACLYEIREELQLQVSDKTVRKAVLKLGCVYKKKSFHALEQERPRCQGQKGGMKKVRPDALGM